MLAKTDQPHPHLNGTIHTAAQQIEQAGGHALPIVGDARAERLVEVAVARTTEAFDGLDTVLNSASAIALSRPTSP